MLLRVWRYLWHQIVTIHDDQGEITQMWRAAHTKLLRTRWNLWFSWGHKLQAHSKKHHAINNVVYSTHLCPVIDTQPPHWHTTQTLDHSAMRDFRVKLSTLSCICCTIFRHKLFRIPKYSWKLNSKNYERNSCWHPTSGFHNTSSYSLVCVFIRECKFVKKAWLNLSLGLRPHKYLDVQFK